MLAGKAGCPLFRGCLSIEVNGRTVTTFRVISQVSAVEGCLSSRVPLLCKVYNNTGRYFRFGWAEGWVRFVCKHTAARWKLIRDWFWGHFGGKLKQPLEQFFQYSNHRLAARQECTSQAKCKRRISCHLVATNFQVYTPGPSNNCGFERCRRSANAWPTTRIYIITRGH